MKPLYVVAVSGGVDSVVLLRQMVNAGEARLVVAHVDHGIRRESGEDARFVERLAASYGLPFETVSLSLGAAASEERAREARWDFLRAVKDRYDADMIATAHHADDVAETMIINLMRGTGWRGIASLRETGEVKRPLLGARKREIVDYARVHQLEWREDVTNHDDAYLRNHVRHHVIPRFSEQQFEKLMELNEKQLATRLEIEREVAARSPALLRYDYVMWPDSVAHEMLRSVVGTLTYRELDRALLFVRTARHQKRLPLSNGSILQIVGKQFIVLGAED